MKTFQFDCGKCKRQVSLALPESSVRSQCPNCGTDLAIEVFPALFTGDALGRAGEALIVDDESSCFYHQSKKAVVACEECGRFLCSLCDIEFNGRHLCSACIEKGKTRGKLDRLQTDRVRYDDIALFLSVLPVIFFMFIWVSFITATAAIFISLRYWKAPLSLIYRSRWRFIVAMVLSFIQLMGWGYFGIRLVSPLF